MKKPFILLLALTALTLPYADAAPPLLSEDFSQDRLPPGWQGRKAAFSIVDGTLRGVAAPDDGHGPSIMHDIQAHDLAVEFDVKFVRPGYFLFLIDGDSQFKGQAHLLRFSISGSQYQLAQDRGDPASKLAQKKARDKRGGKRIPPTKAQLADPSFYRIERLAHRKAKQKVGTWQHVRIELRGNQVTAWLDQEKLTATGTVWDVPKSRIVFLVAQSGDVRIDNVKANRLDADK